MLISRLMSGKYSSLLGQNDQLALAAHEKLFWMGEGQFFMECTCGFTLINDVYGYSIAYVATSCHLSAVAVVEELSEEIRRRSVVGHVVEGHCWQIGVVAFKE